MTCPLLNYFSSTKQTENLGVSTLLYTVVGWMQLLLCSPSSIATLRPHNLIIFCMVCRVHGILHLHQITLYLSLALCVVYRIRCLLQQTSFIFKYDLPKDTSEHSSYGVHKLHILLLCSVQQTSIFVLTCLTSRKVAKKRKEHARIFEIYHLYLPCQ